MSGLSVFSMVRTSVDGFFEGLLAEVPHHVNPNLRSRFVFHMFWAKGTDNLGNQIPAPGLQVSVAIYPGSVASVPGNQIVFQGGQFQTVLTGGTVVAAPGGTTPPIATAQGVTDANGNLTLTLVATLDTSQAYYIGIGDAYPGGADDTTVQELGLLPWPQSDWGGAEGMTFGFTTGAMPSTSGSQRGGPSGGPGWVPTHHGKMP